MVFDAFMTILVSEARQRAAQQRGGIAKQGQGWFWTSSLAGNAERARSNLTSESLSRLPDPSHGGSIPRPPWRIDRSLSGIPRSRPS
jgi:hypothetical protein